MPVKKTFEEAENYGIKNYFRPEYKMTIHGNWEVWDQYDKGHPKTPIFPMEK